MEFMNFYKSHLFKPPATDLKENSCIFVLLNYKDMGNKRTASFYDYDGRLSQKQAKWYYKLDKCPKYFITKHNHDIGGRLELVGRPKIQVITDLMNDPAYRKHNCLYSDFYHKPGYGFMTIGGQGYERIYKEGRIQEISDFKRPNWKPFCLVYNSYDYSWNLLESWDDIFEYASDRDFKGTLCIYKNPEQ